VCTISDEPAGAVTVDETVAILPKKQVQLLV